MRAHSSLSSFCFLYLLAPCLARLSSGTRVLRLLFFLGIFMGVRHAVTIVCIMAGA
ncbi:MAG: hypothetical protein K5657_04105 [Desulfovibrio sp.]|nr:hypothetical protein [Desulfovibrio sp.]